MHSSCLVRGLSGVFLLFFSITLLTTSIGWCELATQQESDLVAQNWLTYTVDRDGAWGGSTVPSVSDVHEIRSGDQLLAWYYDVEPGGYVVVPVLKELPPVKMYSDESNLDEKQNGGVLALLEELLVDRYEVYVERMGSLDASQPPDGDVVFGRSHRLAWDQLAVEARDFRPGQSLGGMESFAQGGPLMTVSWDQHSPFNDLCPVIGGDTTPVGCAATAAVQLMYHYQWPPHGIGSHSYDWYYYDGGPVFGGVLSADFSDDYDWTNMVDSCDLGCSAADSAAMAELSYEVGVSFNMGYSIGGSGALGTAILTALPKYFVYDPDITMYQRKNYSLGDWFTLIQSEIDLARPIYYNIYMHSVVCDGWRDDGGQYEYHMNYGWAGSHTAWYVLDSLYCYWAGSDSVCYPLTDHLYTNVVPQTDPILNICGYTVDDTMAGDGDGILEPGELARIGLTVRNTGADATNVFIDVHSPDPLLMLMPGSMTLGSIASGETVTVAEVFEITADLPCPDPYTGMLEVAFPGISTVYDTLAIHIGSTAGFFDALENSERGWRHDPFSPAFADDWRLDSSRYHNAAPSWHSGTAGDLEWRFPIYDAALVTPPILLPPVAELSFWHYIDAELNFGGTAQSGGVVYISTGDCEWIQIEPIGGYPDTSDHAVPSEIRGNIPCFSGLRDWEQVYFDLREYSGQVRLMFRYAQPHYGYTASTEGWYIDDIEVYSVFGVDQTIPGRLALDVDAGTNISATFSEDIIAGTLNSSSVKVCGSYSGPSSGSISYDAGSQTMTFDPSSDFLPGEIVTATLTDLVAKPGPEYLTNGYSWSFTVAANTNLNMSFTPQTCSTIVGMPNDMITADLDNDGDLDLAFTDYIWIKVYHNDGAGVFSLGDTTDFLWNEPWDIESGDFNGDGFIDLVCTNGEFYSGMETTISVFMNAGDGTFGSQIDYTVGYMPRSVDVADLDNDTDLDLLVTTGSSDATCVIGWNTGFGNFALDTVHGEPSFNGLGDVADVNSDGLVDILLANMGDSIKVLTNLGGGNFATPKAYFTDSWTKRIYPNDFNGDSHVDLFILNEPADYQKTVLLNDGQGNYPSYTNHDDGSGSFYGGLCDIDGDGDMDAILPDYKDEIRTWINDGSGGFSFGPILYSEVDGIETAIVSGDFDGDGDVDLINSAAAAIGILWNSVCPADADGDGYGDPGHPENDCPEDNCPFYSNPDQADSDSDGVGDACTFTEQLAQGHFVADFGVGVTVEFYDVIMPGPLELTVSDSGPTSTFAVVPSTMPMYYDISTTASYAPPITICITYDDTDMTEDEELGLTLMHYDEGAGDWVDITTSLDIVTNEICGETDGFSPFAVALPASGCCGAYTSGMTGNANCSDDGKLTLSDIAKIIDHVYISKDPLCCYASGNTNGSEDCKITLSDITCLINLVYISKADCAPCMPECEQ